MGWDPASERLRLKGVLGAKPLIGPRMVNVHLTNACDRVCRFCWYFSPMLTAHPRRKDLPFAVFKALVRDCAGMGVEEMNLEGGEVVLYPHIAEAFRWVCRHKMRLSAYTHLAYGRAHIPYIGLADSLNVNLSATDAKAYRWIHGADRFEDVMDNLQLLWALRKKYGKPRIVLSFIINERNYREIGAFLDLAEGLSVERVSFRLFEATVEMKELVFSRRSSAALRRIVGEFSRKKYAVANNLSEIEEIISRDGFVRDQASMSATAWNNDRLFYYHAPSEDKVKCYNGWYHALIDERGRVVVPCDNVGVCIAGNIQQRSFRDIWFRSRKFQEIRLEAMRGVDCRKGRWRECRYCGHVAFNRSIEKILAVAQKGRCDAGH